MTLEELRAQARERLTQVEEEVRGLKVLEAEADALRRFLSDLKPLHWTQRPENRGRVKEITEKASKARR